MKVNYDSKYKKALETVKANYATFEVPYYGLDNNDYVNGLGFCCNPAGDTSGSVTGKMSKNDNAELQQFYYHPDHLGSSSYISNLDGEVVQHVEYVPFGEVFLEEKNAKWNTPYLFTSKELDKETGLYYFGARYQDPKLGIFISVDPLAEKHPSYSSYGYVANNPVKFIDPDGKDWIVWTSSTGQQHITYDTSVKTMAQARAGIYKNATRVFADGTAHSSDYNQRVEFAANGNYVVNNGAKKDIDDGGFTLNKTYISKNKSAIDMAGDIVPGAMQDVGSSLTLAAIPVSATAIGAPAGAVMASVGGLVSTIGTVFELLNDAFEGKLTIEKSATKVGMYLLSRNIGGSSASSMEKIAADNVLNGTDKGLDKARELRNTTNE